MFHGRRRLGKGHNLSVLKRLLRNALAEDRIMEAGKIYEYLEQTKIFKEDPLLLFQVFVISSI